MKVELITHTELPLESLYVVWKSSRVRDYQHTAEQVKWTREAGHPQFPGAEDWEKETYGDFHKVVPELLTQDNPVLRHVHFSFNLTIPIALREQMVRHIVGVKVGDNYGVDTIPELGDSSWWSQTMRTLRMDTFVKDGNYYVPDSADDTITEFIAEDSYEYLTRNQLYVSTLQIIEEAIGKLVESGMPIEDARMLVPLAATHDIVWTMNLATFRHVLGKRSCWIAQGGMWNPIIQQMCEIMRGIDPLMSLLIDPPCFKNDKWVGCPYGNINDDRIYELDGETEPPCSLYLGSDQFDKSLMNPVEEKELFVPTEKLPRFEQLKGHYTKLWGRNPVTGERIVLA